MFARRNDTDIIKLIFANLYGGENSCFNSTHTPSSLFRYAFMDSLKRYYISYVYIVLNYLFLLIAKAARNDASMNSGRIISEDSSGMSSS